MSTPGAGVFHEGAPPLARVAATSAIDLRSSPGATTAIAASLLALVDHAVVIADGHGMLIGLNDAGAAVAGQPIGTLIGQRLGAALPLRRWSTGRAVFPLDAADVPGCLMAHLPGQRGEFRIDWRTATESDGREVTVFILIDETPARALQEALHARETIDPVTGVLNRQQFEARVDVALATCRDGPGTTHALCHLDIDHFRLVNDALGPTAGDGLLWKLAATIDTALQAGDAIGRIGDSSFGLLLDGTGVGLARQRAEQIVAAIGAEGFDWDERSFDVSSSVGVVAISSTSRSTAELLRQASVACLHAKQEGRGNVVVGGDTRQASSHVRQLKLGSSIKQALVTGLVSLAGQEIVATGPGISPVRYYELLLRMSDGRGRLTPAGDLVGAAERFDLMRPIDRWVLDEALDRLGEQVAAVAGLSISINLSASSLSDASFLPYLLDVIDRSPVDATSLTFELTETAVMRQPDAAHRTIDALHDAGCRIALDDFGVGLSNFDYLQRFPVDVVKIDGSFVRHMLTRPRDAAIVETIVTLARRLGAQTVVEHVESAELMAQVIALGADFAQGYHLGRPRPFTEILDDLVSAGSPSRPSRHRWREGHYAIR